MGATQVLAPIFVQVALTFGLLFWMGKLRIAAVRGGVVRLSDVANGQPDWPPKAIQVGAAFRNQCELPILFYLVIVLSLFTASASATLVLLAWIFVGTRILHALIHVTTNNVTRRFFLYTAGMAVLVLMWIDFFFQLYFGGTAALPPLDIDVLDVPLSGQ